MHLQSKLPNVGTTIFTVMSGLAQQHGAINLGQGYPDYPMDMALAQQVTKAMYDGYNQYVPMPGYRPLLEAIAAKVHTLYGAPLNPADEITITPGGTYAIYSAITSVLRAGDEVIVFEPAYDSYIPNIELNGGVAIRIPLQAPHYTIPWAQVHQAITPRTRMLILNTPHNPTGQVWHPHDVEELIKLVADTQIIIVSDEVYEHLIYDGRPHLSMLRYPELRQRSFVCFSFGKVYNCTGWKLGYCIAPPAFTTEFRKVHQYNCFSCHSPMQVALAGYLQNQEAYLQLGPQLQERRDYFAGLMAQTPLERLPSQGSYFELYRYRHLSPMPEMEMAHRLVTEAGVAAIPVSAFYQQPTEAGVLRFCFSKNLQTLEEAVHRLRQFNWEA